MATGDPWHWCGDLWEPNSIKVIFSLCSLPFEA